MSPCEGAYGPTRYKPSVPASQLHTLPVYTVNMELASLVALERSMDEKDAVQALRDERTDQAFEGIFRQVTPREREGERMRERKREREREREKEREKKSEREREREKERKREEEREEGRERERE